MCLELEGRMCEFFSHDETEGSIPREKAMG